MEKPKHEPKKMAEAKHKERKAKPEAKKHNEVHHYHHIVENKPAVKKRGR
jgi:hypothetical protein